MNILTRAELVFDAKAPEPDETGPETDQRRIADHLGPGYRITPIGARRFRCNRYARAVALHAAGWLVNTFVLRVTETGFARVSDREAPSDRVRSW